MKCDEPDADPGMEDQREAPYRAQGLIVYV